ncbi:MAG: hypothetical protein Q6358_02955, partial [Candidatus Brocadiales bacterium]|nr:hypothetical protein [Candidatus Brocadiales bacterium]
LHGTDPATIPIKNIVPEKLVINKQTLRGLKDTWQLPEDVLKRADEIIGQTEVLKNKVAIKAVSLNFEVAKKLGITFPPEAIKEADTFIPLMQNRVPPPLR